MLAHHWLTLDQLDQAFYQHPPAAAGPWPRPATSAPRPPQRAHRCLICHPYQHVLVNSCHPRSHLGSSGRVGQTVPVALSLRRAPRPARPTPGFPGVLPGGAGGGARRDQALPAARPPSPPGPPGTRPPPSPSGPTPALIRSSAGVRVVAVQSLSSPCP